MNIHIAAEVLQEKMKTQGRTILSLSKETGLTEQTIRQLLIAGKCRMSTAEVLCKALGLTVKDVFISSAILTRHKERNIVTVNAEVLCELMIERGWTAKTIAKKADISHAPINYMMHGKTVRRSTVEMIADALGVPVERLIVSEKGAAENGSREDA